LKAATSGHTALKKKQSIRIKNPDVSSFVVHSGWSQAGEGEGVWSREQSGAA